MQETAWSAPMTRPDDPRRIVAIGFGKMADLELPYPGQLPQELEPWHVYVVDQGHCIIVVPESLWETNADPEELTVPVPVKTVLRLGVQWRNGWPVCKVSYDEDFGLVGVEEGDEEWQP